MTVLFIATLGLLFEKTTLNLDLKSARASVKPVTGAGDARHRAATSAGHRRCTSLREIDKERAHVAEQADWESAFSWSVPF